MTRPLPGLTQKRHSVSIYQEARVRHLANVTAHFSQKKWPTQRTFTSRNVAQFPFIRYVIFTKPVTLAAMASSMSRRFCTGRPSIIVTIRSRVMLGFEDDIDWWDLDVLRHSLITT